MNKKLIIVVFVVIVIFYIFMSIATKSTAIGGKYIVLDDNNVWKYENKEWKEYTDFNKLNNKKFNFYDNNLNLQSGKIEREKNTWKIKDESKQRFLVASTQKVKIPEYKKETVTDKDDSFVKKSINEYSDEIKERFRSYKIKLDINNDGIEETIYSISSFDLDQTSYVPYSKISIFYGNSETTLVESYDTGYELKLVLNIDKDDEYEIIVSKTSKQGKEKNTCYQLYDIESGKFNLERDCFL